jgi:hypothetical protein
MIDVSGELWQSRLGYSGRGRVESQVAGFSTWSARRNHFTAVT